MKLAFVLFKYFPFGGLQRDFVRIAAECVNLGHTVDVFTMHWEGERDPRLSIHEIPVSGWQNHTRSQAFVAKISPQLAQYDLVVGFNKMPGLDIYYAADTCFQAKTEKKHGKWYQLLPRYRHLVSYEKAVFAADKKTKILLISSLQQAEFERFYQTPAERFYLLPPGIAKDRIAPPNAKTLRKNMRAMLSVQDNEFLLLMVGSGFKTKGLDRTLKAIAALPETLKVRTRLFVVGKDHAQSFERLAKSLQISEKVTFLGGRSDIPEILLAADLLLHPAYNENTGTVLLEALVAGLPVIATDICGYAHYIQEANAGKVLPSPFQQSHFNQELANVLSSMPCKEWQENALAFARTADIYSMPARAAAIIEMVTR